MKIIILIALAIFLVFLSPINVRAQNGWKTYTVDDKYTFQYPSNWKLHERENRFTDTDAFLNSADDDKNALKIISV